MRGKKRIGRGGKRGTYSGRGIKGQKAHASGGIRPGIRDRIKKIPKRRGYGKNRSRSVNDATSKPIVIALGALDKFFDEGSGVSPQTLLEKGLLRKRDLTLPIKILGNGTITKRVTVTGVLLSGSARKAIEDAGGTVLV